MVRPDICHILWRFDLMRCTDAWFGSPQVRHNQRLDRPVTDGQPAGHPIFYLEVRFGSMLWKALYAASCTNWAISSRSFASEPCTYRLHRQELFFSALGNVFVLPCYIDEASSSRVFAKYVYIFLKASNVSVSLHMSMSCFGWLYNIWPSSRSIIWKSNEIQLF